MGAWIETQSPTKDVARNVSHPTWVRGLKRLYDLDKGEGDDVAPYVGAWIETSMSYIRGNASLSHPTWVRGLKHSLNSIFWLPRWSHPTWVRGLKQVQQKN